MGGPFFGPRPALRFVLFFVAGILLSNAMEIDVAAGAILCTILLFLSALAYLRSAQSGIGDLLLSLLVVSLGFMLHSGKETAVRSQRVESVRVEELVDVRGVITSVPQKRNERWRFVVACDTLVREDGTIQRGLTLLAFARQKTEREKPYRQGAGVRFPARLQPYPIQRNPGEFDYGRYLELNEIDGLVITDGEKVRRRRGDTSTTVRSIFPRMRSFLGRLFKQYHHEEVSSFLSGIILAERSGISDEVKQSFVNTGTIHVLAVSGLHVGIVALIFHALFGLLRLKRHAVTICTILGLIGYMVLTGAPPSVTRATIMACMILSARFVERRVDIYQSIGMAALIILIADTNQLFHVGFQLSFAAVLSIVYLYPKLERLIKLIPPKFEEIKAVDYILKLFAVSLAAQLGTLPFTAYYFGRVSIVAIVANLFVVPIIGLNVTIGFATALSSFLSSWIAHSFGAVNSLLVSFVLGFVEQAARVPYAYLETPNLHASFAFLYYLGLIVLFNGRNAKLVKSAIALIVVGLSVQVYSEILNPPRPILTISTIDVGQGDAILLETPRGKRILIDAGPSAPGFDSGERVVGPYLRRRGIGELDALLITHPHGDHIGGASHILRKFEVSKLLESQSGGNSSTYSMIREIAAERKVPVEVLRAGSTIAIDSSIRIYVLHPHSQRDASKNQNDMSLVIRVVYGQTSFLFPGDAEAPAEGRMVHRYGTFLSSDVLKTGHHGSITSTSDPFLEMVSPGMAIVSVGRKNKFNHPSRVVIERLAKRGVAILRTDYEGAVILRSDGVHVDRVSWRSSGN